MNSRDNNVDYRSLSRIYDLFDLIFLLGGKGNPRTGLSNVISDCQQNVLDVCVGTASSALAVASSHKDIRVIGVDISQEMLSVAARKIAQRKLQNVELRQMSAENMSFADASFDMAMVSFALHEFDKNMRERVFREIVRVLRPGGLVCVIDFSRQANTVNQIFLKIWALSEPACFQDFLDMDWRRQLASYGLSYESEQEFSFSKLYVLRKS